MSILICCIVILPCSAHPGRTDSKGGHYDHDTGEYHYHNDGSPQNAPQYGSSGTTKEYNTAVTRYYDNYNYNSYDYDAEHVTENEKEDEEKSNSGYITYIVISIIVFIILISAVFIYRSDCKKLENYKEMYFDEQRKVEKLSEEKIAKTIIEKEKAVLEVKCKSYEKQIDFKTRDIRLCKEEIELLERKIAVLEKYSKPAINLIDVPKDSTIGVDHFPKEKRVKYEWGNKYTFFVSKNYKYHKSSCNCVKYCTPMNAYEIKQDGYAPCSKCKPILPDMEWVDKYFEIIKERQDNDIFFEFDINPR